jgi:sulfate/thiosulfate transport system permease protein
MQTASQLAREARAVRPVTEPPFVRAALTLLAIAFLAFFLIVPLAAVFMQAFEKGVGAYLAAIREPDAWAAMRLTLLTAAIAVPVNVVFGLVAAWTIAKFEFRGKNLLATLIDLPFAVSPVIAGMVFVLLFGRRGVLGPWLMAHDV